MSPLDAEDLLLVARRTLPEVRVRDLGLLAAAAARPYASAFGEDAYPSVHLKAAALVHSLAKDHALVDGNKRLALASLITFLGLHDLRLTLDNAAAYDLIIAIVVDELADVESIALLLEAGTAPF